MAHGTAAKANLAAQQGACAKIGQQSASDRGKATFVENTAVAKKVAPGRHSEDFDKAPVALVAAAAANTRTGQTSRHGARV